MALSRLKHGFESRRERHIPKPAQRCAGFFFAGLSRKARGRCRLPWAGCGPSLALRPLRSLNYRRTRHGLHAMPFVVTENCIKCKYTDCVEVCPVDCFHEGPNFLVIDPDECIDCTLCEPECPINAIYPEDDVPAGQEALRRAQRRAGQGLAGDHHAQGRARPTPRNGKASRTSCRCWNAERRTALATRGKAASAPEGDSCTPRRPLLPNRAPLNAPFVLSSA